MKVTFIVADTHATYIAVAFENEHRQYARRAVTVELTPEQIRVIGLRSCGNNGGVEAFEEVLDCFIDNSTPPQEQD